MIDDDLAKLPLADLLAFQADIHAAIRAAIRAQQAQKAAATQYPTGAKPAAAAVSVSDLERERDAWLSKRSSASRS